MSETKTIIPLLNIGGFARFVPAEVDVERADRYLANNWAALPAPAEVVEAAAPVAPVDVVASVAPVEESPADRRARERAERIAAQAAE